MAKPIRSPRSVSPFSAPHQSAKPSPQPLVDMISQLSGSQSMAPFSSARSSGVIGSSRT
jgi:hypothetical protein